MCFALGGYRGPFVGRGIVEAVVSDRFPENILVLVNRLRCAPRLAIVCPSTGTPKIVRRIFTGGVKKQLVRRGEELRIAIVVDEIET